VDWRCVKEKGFCPRKQKWSWWGGAVEGREEGREDEREGEKVGWWVGGRGGRGHGGAININTISWIGTPIFLSIPVIE
jgi:hypothetical protein